MALVDAHNSAIPGAIPQNRKDLSDMRRTTTQNFTWIGKAPYMNLVSHPILRMAGWKATHLQPGSNKVR